MAKKDGSRNDSSPESPAVTTPKRAGRAHESSVVGKVEDVNGTGIAFVRVVLGVADGGGELEFADTNQQGQFTFTHVKPGSYTVRLDEVPTDLDGTLWRPVPGDSGERPIDVERGYEAITEPITLEPVPVLGAITGFVLDVGRASGLAGVSIELQSAGAPVTVMTGADGHFEFSALAPRDYRVRLGQLPAGYRLHPPGDGQREVTIAAGEIREVVPILLEPVPVLGAITGFVLDVGRASGLAGISIELQSAGAPVTVMTGADGHFEFSALASRDYRVRLGQLPAGYRLHPPDDGQREVTIAAGEIREVVPILLEPVPVPPTGTIRGSVRSGQDAVGVEAIEVETELVGGGVPRRERTLGDGTFSFANVPPGDYRVGLRQVPAPAGGRLWQPPPPDNGERNVTVATSAVDVAPIVVEPIASIASSVTGEVRRVTDGSGIAGVQVTLRAADADGSSQTETTNHEGGFEFANVRPGAYVLALAQDPVLVGNERLEPVLADPDQGRREVQVPVNARVPVPPILLEPERHRIFGTVRTRPGGPGAAFAELRVLDGRGNLLATVQADRNGEYEYRADASGRYLIEVVQDGVRHVDTVDLQSDFLLDPAPPDSTAVDGRVAPTPDFATFPVLTEAVSLPQAPAPRGGPVSSVGQTVESALRDALGWRPRANDPRGFSAALVHSFNRREVDGHTVATWTPRTYAAQVQADLGAITGAQASLYSRARVALDAALPLLDGLYPLNPAADPQDTEAIRAIIRSELTELVAELGVEGGPRLSRVDDLLDLLLDEVQNRVPGQVGGQLALLEGRFGLTPDRVDTIEEEEDLTNFLILVDYVREIDTSWRAQRGFFDPASTATPFLGTQLVLLSRSLAVVAESVTEVDFTLDSVFLGAAERLAIRLSFNGTDGSGSTLVDSRNANLSVPTGTPSILLGELLSWVERVASEEGPQLLQDGGKDGATALTPVLDKLRSLVRASLVTTGSGPNRGLQSPDTVPAGYATARVQRALAELAKYLDDTADLARRIRRP